MKKSTVNLHITLTPFRNETRVLKETGSLINGKLVEKILIVALHEDELKEFEEIDFHRSVWRVKLKSRHWSKYFLVQVFKYIEFLLQVSYFAKQNNVNIVNIHSLGLLPLGVWLKVRLGAKLIYDTHELETEVNGLTGIRKLISKIIEKILINFVDLTIVVGWKIENFYRKKYELTQIVTALNCPPFHQANKNRLLRENLNIPDQQKILLYQGGLSPGRGIEFLLETFQSSFDENYALVFMGYGQLTSRIKAVAEQYPHIYYYPAVSPTEVLNYTASADVGLSLIEDSCLSYRYCLPNKLFEYIMARIPVIVSNLPEMREVVCSYQVGVVMEDWKSQSLLNALTQLESIDSVYLSSQLSKANQEFCWEQQEKAILEAYRRYLFNSF
jgi:glycosyltransferase involved in cell wall biosynthesis